jgi:hypothetical protein
VVTPRQGKAHVQHQAPRVHDAAQRPGRSRRAGRQGERMRRVDVLVSSADRDLKARAGFRQGLEKLGWSEDRNVRIDAR